MSIFIDESEIKSAVESAITNADRWYKDNAAALEVLAAPITKSVVTLLELKAFQAVAEGYREGKEEAKAEATQQTDEFSQTAAQQIRSDAYSIAIRSLNGATVQDSTLHGLASDIADRILDGHPCTAKTEVFVTSPASPDWDKFLDDLFGRNEWRREGWNDARSVMIRSINEQLRSPRESHVLWKFRAPHLKVIRDFIGSFKFDPAKP